MVWDSWSSYYEDVREEDIVRNADWIAANLKPYGYQYVQLDDGYDRGKRREHYWIEKWGQEKFPHGPKWLTDYIKSKGLRAGIWLVPNAYAGAVEQHPDWYLRYKETDRSDDALSGTYRHSHAGFHQSRGSRLPQEGVHHSGRLGIRILQV